MNILNSEETHSITSRFDYSLLNNQEHYGTINNEEKVKEYTCGGITIYREIKFMKTNIILGSNNEHLMGIYTYVNRKEASEINNNDYSALLYKDCYDSFEEAENQVNINSINKSNLLFVWIQVNMTNTVFDKLSTADTNLLENFYNQHQNKIKEAYKKDKNKLSLDTFVILCFKSQINKGIGIIRDIEKIKQDKHDLKCVSQRQIIKYNIIDTYVITNRSFQTI